MKKLVTICVAIIVFPLLGFSQQQGDYVRKSITSVESVWMKPGSQQGIRLDFPFFNRMVEAYIEMPRFDYNELPDTLLTDFRNRANALSTINENSIANLLQETVGEEILGILNDPEIMQARGLALRDESAWQTFASTKARSLGLTTDELETLMNSSYIYLPFITKIELTDREPIGRALLSEIMPAADADNHYVYIEGGIVWFSVNVNPQGEVSIKELLAVSASAHGSREKGDSGTFRFGNETWSLSDTQYALYDATQAWVRNLGVKTKEIPEFILTANIVEALPRKRYSLDIGKREGVYVDDIYQLLEVRLNEQGQEELKPVGYTRVVKVGDNREESYNYSTANQLLGREQGVGIVAREYPRVGYDLKVRLGATQGLNLTLQEVPGLSFFSQTDIENSTDFQLVYAYNLAPITGRSQSFLDLDLRIGFPEYTRRTTGQRTIDNVSILLGQAYLGYTKKYWFGGRHNVGFNLGGGLDFLTYKVEYTIWDEDLTMYTIGGKFGLDYEFLITPALSFGIGGGYKVTTEPFFFEYKINNVSWGGTVSDVDMGLGGAYFHFGINYSLRQMGFNLFGFLDGFKEY